MNRAAQNPNGLNQAIERTRAGVPEVTAAWLRRHLGVRLVDVREPAEWNHDGRIQGAELVPLSALERASASWDRTTPIVIVCRSGRRSAHAATFLEGQGFSEVASLRGGMLAWHRISAAGEPVFRR